MKVRELKALLKDVPDELEVVIEGKDSEYSYPIVNDLSGIAGPTHDPYFSITMIDDEV